MAVLGRQAVRRWAVVAAGVAVLCAVPAAIAALPVRASALTAAQLRTRIAASADVSYQGYAQSYVDLGLPSLPDLGNVISLLDGNTNQYVWYRSPGSWRADQLTTAGENDIYQTSRGTYLWNYTNNQLTRVVGAQPVRLPQAPDLLPPELARRLVGFASRATRFAGCRRSASPGSTRPDCAWCRWTRRPPSAPSRCGLTRVPACRWRLRYSARARPLRCW